ncbi:MAG: carbohydrate ABC transporter permease [Anaerolineaceae bacterium]|jgi:putative aldouronate transport system permease protein|nr:carbohydrate ABC transporter permease [Anaerolineaceae bacterium]
MIREHSLKYKIIDSLIILFLVLIFLTCVIPFIHELAISFSGRADVQGGKVGLWPTTFTLDNYKAVIGKERFGEALMISILRVLIAIPSTLLIVVMTAYPLALEKIALPGRKLFLAVMIFANMFQVGLIPRFLSFNNLGLIDNFLVLILPLLLNTFNVILAINHIKSIPYELVESAMLDGATHWQIITRIMVPLSKPVLATISLFTLVQHWNSWFDGIIFLRNTRLWPLGSYLYSLLTTGALSSEYAGFRFSGTLPNVSPAGAEAAMIFFSALPVLIVYPLLQRYIIAGMTLGAVKE